MVHTVCTTRNVSVMLRFMNEICKECEQANASHGRTRIEQLTSRILSSSKYHCSKRIEMEGEPTIVVTDRRIDWTLRAELPCSKKSHTKLKLLLRLLLLLPPFISGNRNWMWSNEIEHICRPKINTLGKMLKKTKGTKLIPPHNH